MKITREYLLLICFAVFIWGFSLLDMLTPPREFSEMENRPLAERPAISARALLGNTYTQRYEQFVNDQFAGRDGWITLKSLGESALLKQENNGVIYGSEGYLFEKAAPIDMSQLERNIGFVSEFACAYPESNITFSIIPASHAVLDKLVPEGAPVTDQIAQIKNVYGKLSGEPLRILDLTPGLLAHDDEYIYYRTDHHWTTLGARYAYDSYMESLGRRTYVPIEDGETHQVPDFYGSHYSKSKNWNALPDVIEWYRPPFEEEYSVTVDGVPADGLYDTEQFERRDKYAAFLHGNNGLTIIRNEALYRDSESEPGRILVFKDSYGNSLIPFLSVAFGEVHVADLRYYSDVPTLMSGNRYDQIYILYSFTSFAEEPNLYKLASS